MGIKINHNFKAAGTFCAKCNKTNETSGAIFSSSELISDPSSFSLVGEQNANIVNVVWKVSQLHSTQFKETRAGILSLLHVP